MEPEWEARMNNTGAGAGSGMGWSLVILGLFVAGIGLCWVLLPNFPKLGRLPGDIVIDGKNSRFYFPVVTCLLFSVALSVIWWIVRAVFK
jgi:hypothetical protein